MARRRRPEGVVLFPGAGSDAGHPSLVAIEARLAQRRPPLPVVRADFPYRTAGRRVPDRPPVLLRSVRDEAGRVAERLGVPTSQLVLGGRSMGGRMCSLAAAGDPGDGGALDPAQRLAVAGLVLISYPLHPPGKPDRLRVAHLPALDVPCLFVHGTRDPFGTPDELTEWTATIAGPVTHVWIEGGRHDLKGADDEIAAAVECWLTTPPSRRAPDGRGSPRGSALPALDGQSRGSG
jgi:hypothetical protein